MSGNDLFPGADDQEPTFEDHDNEPQKYLDELVGDGKKFTDAEALARGKWESDRFVTKLQSELRELREDLNSRVSLEQQLKELRSALPAASNPSNQGVDERANENTALTEEQVAELVSRQYNKQKEVDSQVSNLEAVRAELEKAWGRDYKRHLANKTQELGLGKDFANGYAATYPKAFLKLMFEGASSGVDPSPPSSTVRLPTTPSGKMLKYRDYQKMRKEDPTLYHSSRIQMEMDRASQELGENFYN